MKRVLMVEDDTWLADSYQRILERAGFAVVCTSMAEEAIRLIEPEAPDVILADVLLEGNTVIGLLHELQSYEDTAPIPVVLCTTLSGDGLNGDRLHMYGVRAVLDKSTLTPEQLVRTLQEAIA